MGSMGTHLPFNPFAFVLEGGEKERERKKRYRVFFSSEKRKESLSSLPYRRGEISIGRVSY